MHCYNAQIPSECWAYRAKPPFPETRSRLNSTKVDTRLEVPHNQNCPAPGRANPIPFPPNHARHSLGLSSKNLSKKRVIETCILRHRIRYRTAVYVQATVYQ